MVNCQWVAPPPKLYFFFKSILLQLPVVEKVEESKDAVVIPQQPLQENKKLTIADFELLKTIGQGSFGKVLQVGSLIIVENEQVRMKENGKIYAMKVLDKSKVLEYGSFCVFEIG